MNPMIGVLDSGLGGVLTAEYIQDCMPAVPLLVFADRGFVPYGEKDPERIRERTFACLHRLFEQGCGLVVLACNTASTHAIVQRQEQFPEKKVLSVTIPGVEAVIQGGFSRIGVLATDVTAKAALYTKMFAKHYANYPIEVQEIAGGSLVSLIEQGADEKTILALLHELLDQYIGVFDALVLGCTHYPLIEKQIQHLMGSATLCIDPGKESARKLKEYLLRHPEIDCTGNCAVYAHTTLVTTGDPDELRQRVATLLGPLANERDCLAVTV